MKWSATALLLAGYCYILLSSATAYGQDVFDEDLMEETFEINQRGAVYDSQTGKRRYDGWQLIRVNPQTDDDLDVLQFLDKGKRLT